MQIAAYENCVVGKLAGMVGMWKKGRFNCALTNGATMIEMIVALAIFTFGAAGAYTHYLNTARRGTALVEFAQARLLAHQQLEQLLACRYERLAAWTPPTGPVQI